MSDLTTFYSQEPGYLDERQSGPGPWDQLVDQRPPPLPASHDPYTHENPYAVGVNQRAAKRWNGHTLIVDGTQPGELVPSQRGRKSVLILVPSTATAGVYIDSTPDALYGGGTQGFLLIAGSAVSIPTEDAVWIVSATAGTDTTVCVLTTWG